jgi:hypothetical protein
MKGITKEEFDKFTEEMWNRLKEGEKKYGCEYKNGDLAISMLEEATDLANYAFMIFLKALKFQEKFIK